MKRLILILLSALLTSGHAQVQSEDVEKLMDVHNTLTVAYNAYWQARGELAAGIITLPQYKQRVEDEKTLFNLAARLYDETSPKVLDSVQTVFDSGGPLSLQDKTGLRISRYVGNIRYELEYEMSRAAEASNKEAALNIRTESEIVLLWQEIVDMSHDMYLHW